MLGGRRKLPVLAQIAGPGPGRTRLFSLRREDLARLEKLQGDLVRRRSVLVTGGEEAGRTVAVALAGAACAAGRRVALVDCDLARRAIKQYIERVPLAIPGIRHPRRAHTVVAPP